MLLDLLVILLFSSICYGVCFFVHRHRGTWTFEAKSKSLDIAFYCGFAFGIVMIALSFSAFGEKISLDMAARLIRNSALSLFAHFLSYRALQRWFGFRPSKGAMSNRKTAISFVNASRQSGTESRIGDEVRCSSCQKTYDFTGEVRCPWCNFQEGAVARSS